MPQRQPTELDRKSPPFDRFKTIQRLATDRSGHGSLEHVRHHLFVGRYKDRPLSVLVKLTSKPGLIYQQTLTNEIETLTTINRALPDSAYFPIVHEHGRLADGRVFLVMSLFDELPLATSIGPEPIPARLVAHIRTTIEVARALADLHRQEIFHVDLNPMNILYRSEQGRPVIRIVDFESSYERARHAHGTFYNPPTTSGYCAPEVSRQAPDARADLFSLGAVLYTMLAGYQWTWEADAATAVDTNDALDQELKTILRTAVDPDPGQRYASAGALEGALGAYLESIWPGRTW